MDGAPRPRPEYRGGRDALLDAAVRVVGREGFRGLTYRAVGSESGTTHGLVSYHFGSRRNLVRAAGAHASRRAVAGARLSATPSSVRDLAADLPRAAAEDADVHAFLFELALESRRDEALREDVLRQYAEYRGLAGRGLAALGLRDDDGALARLVFAAIDGLTLQQLLDGDSRATARAVEELQRLVALLAPKRPTDGVTRSAPTDGGVAGAAREPTTPAHEGDVRHD